MFHRLDFCHERELSIDDLVRRVEAYYPEANIVLLRKAYEFAAKAHKGQKRSSGENYIIHPVNVAATLIKLQMDMDSIIAGLLHDVIEDCSIVPEDIEKEFSKNIAQIVVGLTKISKITFKTVEESQAENFRKMVVAMAKDLRVLIVKLADRMHNMRTLQYISEGKQKKIAQETLDIYVPLASRLGINSVKDELEDLCLRFLHTDIYYRLAEKVAMKKSERDTYIEEVVEVIQDKLLEYSLKANVKGRPKHFYSIYKKMKARGVDFDQIQDVLAFRIIVNNITECYKALGVIHSAFIPIPGRFKDYVAIPKVNNYQSLHTSVIGPKAERIEIQIRTVEMDQVAKTGVAAHWRYKEGLASGDSKLDWVQELLEFNQSVKSNSEFMDVVKNDLDVGEVFVFTPKGDIRELRYGATPLDFAYAVHTEVGNHCIGAKVNGKIVPLRHRLKSGDTIDILTNHDQTPSKDWLKIVKTSRARSKIRQWLLKIEREGQKELGREVLGKALKVFSTSIGKLKKSGEFSKMWKQFNDSSEDKFYISIGSGKISAKQIVEKFPSLGGKSLGKEEQDKIGDKIEEINRYSQSLKKTVRKKLGKRNSIIVDGMSDVLVRMGRCCNPIPGDGITGYITRGRGITVHTVHCKRANLGDVGKQVEVEWNSSFQFKHPVNIRVITHDKPGILSQISKAIHSTGVNIKSALAKSLPDRKGSFVFEIEVMDYSELLKTVSNIEALEEVINVARI